jgi:hypothetical protein
MPFSGGQFRRLSDPERNDVDLDAMIRALQWQTERL